MQALLSIALLGLMYFAIVYDPKARDAAASAEPDSTSDPVSALDSGAGARAEPEQGLNMSVYRSSIAVRIWTLFLTGMLIWVAKDTEIVELPRGLRYAIYAFSAYYSIYIWVFRVELDRREIRLMGPFLSMKRYKLNDLVDARQDRNFTWRLQFANGETVYMLSALHGADELSVRLKNAMWGRDA